MKKTGKGKQGYVQYERVKRALIMLLMFAIPIGIYLTAWKITGSNRNIMTIVAIVGIIPAARFAVSWIMIMLSKQADPAVVELTEQCAGELPRGYELTVTAYDGRLSLDAVVVCGNEVAAFCGDRSGGTGGTKAAGQPGGRAAGKGAGKDLIPMMEKHITKILNSNGYFGVNVKIFDNEKHYRERILQLAADPARYRDGIRFTPDERYPQLSRDELVLHTIMAISV